MQYYGGRLLWVVMLCVILGVAFWVGTMGIIRVVSYAVLCGMALGKTNMGNTMGSTTE